MMNSQGRGRLSYFGSVICSSRGYLLAFLSGLIYSLVTVLVKYMRNIPPAQLMVYRYTAVLALNLPPSFLCGKNVFGPRDCLILMFIRSISGATSVLLHFFAFRFLPLGEATVLISSYPAFVTVAAKVFLKESFGLLQMISVLTTIIGVILTTGLCETLIENSASYTKENIYGLASGLASIAFITVHFILIRKLRHIDYRVMLFNSSVVAIIESVIVTEILGGCRIHYKGTQQLFIILVGVLSYVGLTTLTVSTQISEAGPVTTIRAATDILFSFIWQVVIFGEVPNGVKIAGATLIFISVALVGLRKRINAFLPEKCVTLL